MACRAGNRRYSHAIIALKIEPSDTEKEVNVTLRRGMTVKGELVGTDDRPAPDAWMFGQSVLRSLGVGLRSWRANYHAIARNGHFEFTDLIPTRRSRFTFLIRRASWARRALSWPSRRLTRVSSSVSSPAVRPKLGWLRPAESRLWGVYAPR